MVVPRFRPMSKKRPEITMVNMVLCKPVHVKYQITLPKDNVLLTWYLFKICTFFMSKNMVIPVLSVSLVSVKRNMLIMSKMWFYTKNMVLLFMPKKNFHDRCPKTLYCHGSTMQVNYHLGFLPIFKVLAVLWVTDVSAFFFLSFSP